MTSEDDGAFAVIGPHPPFRGGIAHFTERTATGFESAGKRVVRISFSRLYPRFLFPGSSQFEPGDESVPIEEAVIDSINPLSWSKAAQQIMESGVSEAIFMYWMPFFAPAYSRIASILRKNNVSVVGIVHNALPHENHPGAATLSRKFLRTCDRVVVLSKSVAADVGSLDPGIEVSIQPHPTYDQFGEPVPRADARARLHLDQHRLVLLFFGVVRPYKGLHVLLDALPRIVKARPHVLLVVAGEFYDDATSYTDQISSLGISENVRLANRYIPADAVRDYFCAADLVVQPYLRATQSGVVAIARHFQRPVVATDVGGLSEELGTNGITVPVNDPRELAKAISEFITDSNLELDDDAALVDQNTHSWKAFVQALLGDR